MPPSETKPATSRGGVTQNVQATVPDPNYRPPESSQRTLLTDSEEESIFKTLFWTGCWDADINSISQPMCGPKRRALVIAVSYGVRSPPSPLTGTFLDAYKIIRLLVSKFGYLNEDICVLADVEDEVGRQNPRRSPDQRNIAEDYRFLFFAGHGYRRTEQLPSSIYEGIMPSDTSFKSFITCEDCACGVADGVSVFQSQKGKVIPHPATIIWGYRINEILASSLADGANLTVVFDVSATIIQANFLLID
ncbi:ICE-like protease (caspase) p20 domain protein [Ceratobasidium sp. AG-Ba]|nr:ICE-like protease (caspase) p20 domain protein [Ceratobasidium sp. AG-Ba]QRW04519.1 ICE-like protease (caspase) p20 domain protein [Ceratobasidium sp. AG-Ba]